MIEWIKNNLVLAIVIAIVIGTVSFVGGIKVADQPFFCGMLCHEMQPHVDSLEANFHSKKGVTCMDCHSEQGFINHAIEHAVSIVFIKPHLTKNYLEDEFGYHKDVKEFKAEEMNFKGKIDSEEEQKLSAKCRGCHPDRLEKSYFMKVPLGHKREMITENCKRCHEAVAGTAKELVQAKTELTDFSKPRKIANMHPLHLGKEILCIECHNRIIHSTNPAVHTPGMEMCFRCHGKSGKAPEVDCATCHLGQVNLFAGVQGKEISESASIMKDIGCTDCHRNNNKFDIQACVECHDDSYKEKLTVYKNNYKTKFEQTQKLYEEVTKTIEEGKSPGQAESILTRAEFNYKYAGLDGSKGMHNPDFTDALLTKTQEDLNEVKKALK